MAAPRAKARAKAKPKVIRPLIGATMFSGIGVPEEAMPEWDWRWAAEIEDFPSAVLKARHPHTVNLGDVNAEDFARRATAIARPDALVFGSPCQSYSIAGNRGGLDDPRGNLALVALRIIGEVGARWVVFENVRDLLSSWSGAEEGPDEAGAEWETEESSDFATFLGLLRQLGYLGCWRVLDAQFAGVPQRRRRIFFVGYLGDWRPPAAVLLEPNSLRRNRAPVREAWQAAEGRPEGAAGGSGALDAAGSDQATLFSIEAEADPYEGVSGSVSSKWAKGSGGPAGDECYNLIGFRSAGNQAPYSTGSIVDALTTGTDQTSHFVANLPSVAPTLMKGGHSNNPLDLPLVAHTLRGEGFDAAEDGGQRGTPLVGFFPDEPAAPRADVANTLNAGMGRRRGGGAHGDNIIAESLVSSISKRGGNSIAPGDPMVAFSHSNAGDGAGAQSPTLRGRPGGDMAVGFSSKDSGGDVGDISPTLRALAHAGSHANGGGQVAVAFQPRIARNGRGQPSEISPALAGADSGATSDSRPMVAGAANIRRLTPRECERLQGLKDDYTLVKVRKGKREVWAADAPRYKAVGNAMARPVVRWILSGIDAYEQLHGVNAQ